MRSRYLVLLRNRRDLRESPAVLASALDMSIVVDAPDLLALVGGSCRHHQIGQGQVLGTLYPRFGPSAPVLDPQISGEKDATAAEAEARLLSRYWGGYIALFPARTGYRVIRDPSASLPCYFAETAAGLALASDVALLQAVGLNSPSIHWTGLFRHYYLRGLPTPETCLQGVEELLPGFALDVSGGIVDQRLCWSPWTFTQPLSDSDGVAPAARIRRTVKASVEALTATHDRFLISVSGGLDSSIVAACLAQAGREVHCMTMFTEDPAGDERLYARALCAHLRLPLIECPYRVEDIDIAIPMSPHLPRPIGRTLGQAYERTHLELAQSLNIDAFVTGNGGDNVFAFSQSAAAVTDRYRQQGISLGLLKTVGDVCRQTDSSPAAVLRAAFRTARKGYRWTPGPLFLDPGMLAALAPGAFHQPWLDGGPAALPGKTAHVASLLRIQHNLEPGRSRFAPVIAPLVSQPVIEESLAIPTWQWRSGGRDRAVARDAFAADLPPMIAGRRSKGGPDGFSASILRAYRDAIRERLLDGSLARHHIVDRAAIEARFRSDRPFSGEEQTRLLDLTDTEAWVRCWSEGAPSISSARAGR